MEKITLKQIPERSWFRFPGKRRRFFKINDWAVYHEQLSEAEAKEKRRSHDLHTGTYARNTSGRTYIFDARREVIPVEL